MGETWPGEEGYSRPSNTTAALVILRSAATKNPVVWQQFPPLQRDSSLPSVAQNDTFRRSAVVVLKGRGNSGPEENGVIPAHLSDRAALAGDAPHQLLDGAGISRNATALTSPHSLSS